MRRRGGGCDGEETRTTTEGEQRYKYTESNKTSKTKVVTAAWAQVTHTTEWVEGDNTVHTLRTSFLNNTHHCIYNHLTCIRS